MDAAVQLDTPANVISRRAISPLTSPAVPEPVNGSPPRRVSLGELAIFPFVTPWLASSMVSTHAFPYGKRGGAPGFPAAVPSAEARRVED